MKYIALLVGGIVIVLTLIGYIAVTQFSLLGEPEPKATATITVTNDEVRASLVAFAQNALNDDGTVTLRQQCEGRTCAPLADQVSDFVSPVILTLLHEAIATGNVDFKNAADASFSLMLARCTSEPDVCLWNLEALGAYYELTGSETYLAMLDTYGEMLLDSISPDSIPTEGKTYSRAFDKLEMLYRLTGDEQYKDAIIASAEDVLVAWPEGLNDEVAYETAAIEVNYAAPFIANGLLLPAYRVSGDLKYLEAITDFFAKAEFSGNMNSFGGEMGTVATIQVANAAYFLVGEDVLTDDERKSMQGLADEIVGGLIGWQFDAPTRPLFTGDGSFVSGNYEKDASPSLNHKHANVAAWVADLLRNERTPDTLSLWYY